MKKQTHMPSRVDIDVLEKANTARKIVDITWPRLMKALLQEFIANPKKYKKFT